MWEIYDAIISGLPENITVTDTAVSPAWTLSETSDAGFGIAMTTPWDQVPAIYPEGIIGVGLRKAAVAAKSWNLSEAGYAIAAANAYYNSPERLAGLEADEPYERYSTYGMDMADKTVGIIGHLKMPPGTLDGAKKVYILERNPQEGDYPDSACDYILPECDIVLITGSSLVNKTLPHLLELTKDAKVILTGPTVPMCPALLDCGIDRLAGLVITDRAGMRMRVDNGVSGPPYRFGKTFLLKRD